MPCVLVCCVELSTLPCALRVPRVYFYHSDLSLYIATAFLLKFPPLEPRAWVMSFLPAPKTFYAWLLEVSQERAKSD